jgi:hypothetical protein
MSRPNARPSRRQSVPLGVSRGPNGTTIDFVRVLEGAERLAGTAHFRSDSGDLEGLLAGAPRLEVRPVALAFKLEHQSFGFSFGTISDCDGDIGVTGESRLGATETASPQN